MNGDLDTALLAAHQRGDNWGLVRLYTEAANRATDPDASGFYLVHAYIFALETAHPDAPALRTRLKADGRED